MHLKSRPRSPHDNPVHSRKLLTITMPEGRAFVGHILGWCSREFTAKKLPSEDFPLSGYNRQIGEVRRLWPA